MPDKQDFPRVATSTEDRIDRTVNAGSQWIPALKNVPQQVYLFGLIPLSLLGVFTYIIITGSPAERQIGLIAIIGIIVLCLVSAFLLLRGISEGADKRFEELKTSHVVLPAPAGGAENGIRVKYEFDLFVSAPMASQSDDERKAYNEKVRAQLKAIKLKCGFSIYYAGDDTDSTAGDDVPQIALRHNVRRMRASKRYMVIYTQYVPTSAFIEMGMALALGKPSVWFVKKGVNQPYLMRGYQAGGSGGLPPIAVHEITDLDDITKVVNINGKEIFDGTAGSEDA
jgi:hypothetical protein